MKLTRAEMETLLRTSAADSAWDFLTLDPKFVRKLTRLGYTLEPDHQGGWSCRIPLRRITFRKREGRKLSGAALRKSQSQGQNLQIMATSDGEVNKITREVELER